MYIYIHTEVYRLRAQWARQSSRVGTKMLILWLHPISKPKLIPHRPMAPQGLPFAVLRSHGQQQLYQGRAVAQECQQTAGQLPWCPAKGPGFRTKSGGKLDGSSSEYGGVLG